MNKAQQLRKIIQNKLYPEGVKLEFGCRVSIATGAGRQRQGKTVLASYQVVKTINGVTTPDYRELLTFSGSGFEKNRIEDLDIEILGKPTTLQEVLLTIGEKYGIDSSGMILERQFGTSEYDCAGIKYLDLKKSIEEQDDDVLDFLIELVK